MLLPYRPHKYDVLMGMDLISQFHVTMYNAKFVISN